MSDDNLPTVDCTDVISTEEPIIQITENGVEGYEILCRLCANRSDHLIPIYSEEGITNDLADKMNLYLPIKISKTDLLPLQCCFQCASTVLTWHELVVASVEADRRLREVQSEVEKQIAEQDAEPGPSQVEEDPIAIDRCATPEKIFIKSEIKPGDFLKEEIIPEKLVRCVIIRKKNKVVTDEDQIDSEEKSSRKTYKCYECEKHFLQKASLERHVRIHRNERPYICDICGKDFRDKSALTRHIHHVHIQTKNFSCDICSRHFASAATRDDHRRSHTKECPFICQICGKKFGRKASLYIHSKIHSDVFPFDCNVCEKKFRRRQELLNHTSTHSGEKQFNCEDCGKCFRVKSALNTHRLVHSNDKPFSCKVCGISYRQARYLRKHNRLKHSDSGINKNNAL